MKIYFMESMKESMKAAAVVVMFLLVGVSVAGAEPECYDFPVFGRTFSDSIKGPVVLASPSMPTFEILLSEDLKAEAIRQEHQRRTEARKQSIAALFRQYNKKLDNDKAVDYANFIMQACEQFKQDPFVIAAMIVNESSARHDAISTGGDYGLMQVRWRVHQKKIRKKYPQIEEANDMFDPKYNVLVGTEIFSTYYATAKQDIRGALMYYTAGNVRHADKVMAVLARLEKSYIERLKEGVQTRS